MQALAAVALAAAGVLLTAAPGNAKATLRVAASELGFYAQSMSIVARGAVTVDAPEGNGSADAAFLDLRRNRLVLAGNAHLGSYAGDAIAVDLDDHSVATLHLEDGAPSGDFAFPDVDPREVFIRSRRATIVERANVRFVPAAFPSSAGAVPVPSYLYTFAEGSGFSAQSLPGASFDQPYGIAGTPSSLLAAHLRYEQGAGGVVAIDHHLVDGDRSYLVTSVDGPFAAGRTLGISGYRRLGARYTTSLDGAASRGFYAVHVGQSAAFGLAGARLDASAFSGGGGNAELSVRSPDRPLFLGLTYRLRADLGIDVQRGGVLPQLADRASYGTLWHHGVDLFVATPQWRGPLGTSVSATFDVARTWYAFPLQHEALTGTVAASRRFGTITLSGLYSQSNDLRRYFGLQGLFYPAPVVPLVAPDGTPWPGFAAFTGASTARLAQFDVQFVTSPTTTYRVTLSHTNDFPQFHGFGRPVDEVRLGARFRLTPNIGVDVARAYDFAWGGTRWQPTWQFSILP